MDIDIGTRALKEDFNPEDQEPFVKKLVLGFTEKMQDIFKEVEIKGFKVNCNPEGELVGKWAKGNMHTMTHQSVLLGIPAMQIEFPRSIRRLLISDRSKIVSLAKCILDTYEQIIVPLWNMKKTDLIVNYSISK